MTERRISFFWISGVVVVGSMLDVWLYLKLGNESTISQTLLWLARLEPIVPMAFGWLCGHFFWPKSPTDKPNTFEWQPVHCVAAVAGLWVLCYVSGLVADYMRTHPTIPFLYGYLCGRLLTPQTDDSKSTDRTDR